MKVIRFRHQDELRIGLLHGDRVIDASRLPGVRKVADLLSPMLLDRGATLFAQGESDAAFADVELLQPYDAQARIFCVGVNYKAHAEEAGHDVHAEPPMFFRTHESVVATGQPIIRPPVSTQLDYEGELAVMISTRGHRIAPERAMANVGGYTCFNDGTLRDYQKMSLSAGKNFDRSGACGPWIVPAGEIPDPNALRLMTRVNGVEVQSTSVDLMIHPIAKIVSFLSQFTALVPGDVIATGTPGGVGARRTPPLWLKSGDLIEIEVTGIGVLRNRVTDEA